ncbi:hypothetical protein LP417_24125 [Polaromonas sp. P1-6]|nr:hypothetical protein LP417_24125 [Polaromonas sp. P1-6]
MKRSLNTAPETAHAAIGGFTTVLGYFLNNEAYSEVYKREQAYAQPRAHVDYGFHFSTASELHVKELESYVKDYGVTSFKYFMNFKGEEGRYLGLDGTDDGYLHALLSRSAEIGGVTVVCHTENIEIVNRLRNAQLEIGIETLQQWESVKPPITEAEACIRAMFLAEKVGAKIYIPHMSSRMGLDEVRFWRQRYDQVYVETCPHYLTHTSDMNLGGMGKANPPFRSKDDQDALWEGLADGAINVVASDHCPRKRVTKDKSFWLASQGFPGTATILPVLLHEGYHKRGLSLRRICELVSTGPARIFDIDQRKGRTAPRCRRRHHTGRPEPRADSASRGPAVVLGLQPLRRLDLQGLGHRDHRAWRDGHEGRQDHRCTWLRKVPLSRARGNACRLTFITVNWR